MKIEIWSDVMCPFCYIGKRKLETALNRFPLKDKVEIEWKSFQLNPDLISAPNKNTAEYLSEHKGISTEEAISMMDNVTQTAKREGLAFHFEKTKVANTLQAHKLLHLSKTQGKQNELEELLFKAHFTDGENVDDLAVLSRLGEQVGLDPVEIQTVLSSDEYTREVQADILEAQKIGVQGVPFFVFNRKYAISGAQDSAVFMQTLEKAFSELA
jgi:predicted DsbA family dithiol-disulfide isomerase